MKGNFIFNRHSFGAALAVLMAGQVATVQAKPGPLATQPLFLGTRVPPNIFFALDDSGSMDWEVLLTSGALAAHPNAPTSGNLDISPSDHNEDREMCAGYNVLAYDPNVNYTPWIGVDEGAEPYRDQSITSAARNPFNPSSGVNLLNVENGHPAVYGLWSDQNQDGDYDAGECPVAGEEASAQNYSVRVERGDFNDPSFVFVDTLPPAEQTNYANWYSYYRKREYVLKGAVSRLIFDSNSRMGLATLHNNNGVGTPVTDMRTEANKEALLEALFNIDSDGGTPLRWLLYNTGRYFDDTDGDAPSELGFGGEPSPILSQAEGGQCQQNFGILMSDGFWNGEISGLGNRDSDGPGPWDGGSHADTYSNTLADFAIYFYERDLSDILADEVQPIPGVDENEAQHLTTFTVAFGVNGMLSSNPTDRDTPFTWPDPVSGTTTTIDDMRHAAWNARGRFLNARDPAGLASALQAALASIEDRQGSAAAATFNANTLDAGSRIFISQFNSEAWTGEVLAFDIDVNTGSVSASPVWAAAEDELDDRDLTADSRVIYTYNGTDGALFEWGSLTDTQKNDLRTDPDGSQSNDAKGRARLDYLRGDRTHEALGSAYDFRARSSRLGDIIHSAPQFVGPPGLNLPDRDPFGAAGDRYSDFETGPAAERDAVLYVGANDGLLHGFSAVNGEEVMAYAPSNLFSSNASEGLHYLTDPSYVHAYYVDQTPAVSDVYISSSWRTVLIGSQRAGGRGLFALDVTDPSELTAASDDAQDAVLWEFTEADDPDLGFTFGTPTITMMNNGEWAAIFGNGYNSSGSGTAKLFILFLEEGLDGWQAGDYVEIDTGAGAAADKNGLSPPAVADLNGDGIADRAYAGDLEGNMWAFDLSDTNEGNWDVAHTSGGNRAPLFTAQANQPITAKPILARLTDVPTTTSNLPNVLVYFGTGQYLVDSDNTTTDQQSFHGVWDTGRGQLGVGDLVRQSFIDDSGIPADARVPTSNPVTYAEPPSSGDAEYGWYIDLPEDGERVIVQPTVRDDLIFFNTLIPETEVCSAGSSGFLMSIDAADGSEPDKAAVDYNNDGVVDDKDMEGGYQLGGQRIDHSGSNPNSFFGERRYTTGTDGRGVSGGGEENPPGCQTDPSVDCDSDPPPPAPPGCQGNSLVQCDKVRALLGPMTGRLSWQELLAE